MTERRKLAMDEIECPKCGQIVRADFVDIGVGMQQCGPFGCEACDWCEKIPDVQGEISNPEGETKGW